jgi:hypothetical protein
MKRKLIFHIGLEKTGTDSFQRFCTEHHKLLKGYSVLYPMKSSDFFKNYNHAPLVACYLPPHDFGLRSSGHARTMVLRSLTAEIKEDDSHTILISGEHFSSRFGDMEIAQLAADFADYDCRIAVVLRDHVSRLYSAYSQTVLSGRDITLDAFCDEVFHPHAHYMRYAKTIQAWEQAFGRESMSVFCYFPGKNIIPTLCENLISSAMPLSSIESYWDNRSAGPGPTERLCRMNRAMARVPVGSSSFAGWLALRYIRGGIAKVFTWLDGHRSEGRWHLSPYNQERLSEIAEADRLWLETHYGVRLSHQAAVSAPPS